MGTKAHTTRTGKEPLRDFMERRAEGSTANPSG